MIRLLEATGTLYIPDALCNNCGRSMDSIEKKERTAQSSVARILFGFAYQRIWKGKTIVVIETILWSVVAVYTGFALYQLTPLKIDGIMLHVSMYGFLIVTPLVVFYAALKAHVTVGMADSSLRNVPLTPSQVLFPRFLAVMGTWIQFATPFIVTFFGINWILFLIFHGELSNPFFELSIGNLLLHTDLFSEFRSGSPIIVPYEDTITYLLAILQILGWGALPVAWGLWWGTRFQHRGGPFILAFFAYVILPVALYFAVRENILGPFIPRGILYWVIVLTTGLSGVALSFVFFALGCKDWARRSG